MSAPSKREARLLSQVRRLNRERAKPLDLCGECCAETWDRPDHDYTRRRCSECGTIRPDPDELEAVEADDGSAHPFARAMARAAHGDPSEVAAFEVVLATLEGDGEADGS